MRISQAKIPHFRKLKTLISFKWSQTSVNISRGMKTTQTALTFKIKLPNIHLQIFPGTFNIKMTSLSSRKNNSIFRKIVHWWHDLLKAAFSLQPKTWCKKIWGPLQIDYSIPLSILKCSKTKPTMTLTGFQSRSSTRRASGTNQTILRWWHQTSFRIRWLGEVTICNIQMKKIFNKIITCFKIRTISLNTNNP